MSLTDSCCYYNNTLAQGYYPDSEMMNTVRGGLCDFDDFTMVEYEKFDAAKTDGSLCDFDDFTMVEYEKFDAATTTTDDSLEDFYEVTYEELEKSGMEMVVKTDEEKKVLAVDNGVDSYALSRGTLCNALLSGMVGISTAATVAPISTMNAIVAGTMLVAPGYMHLAATFGLTLVNNAGAIGAVAKGFLVLNNCNLLSKVVAD